MPDPIQILWRPAGFNLDALGTSKLVDVTDGDTPNIRMAIRMLSVDTPETTAGSEGGAERVDDKFTELAQWIEDGKAPVTQAFADHILPRLQTGKAGTLQFTQGKAASAFLEHRIEERTTRPDGSIRKLFMRAADERFDGYGRLLAYVAPSYSWKERQELSRKERATFNLDLVESGHAMTFILYPSIPGELDMPLMLEAAEDAMDAKRGQHAEALFMPAYEYRACEKLYGITKKLVEGEEMSYPDQLAWRSRYCVDMRNRQIHGPEDYMGIAHPYRLWLWPDDVQTAMGALNLIPAPSLVG
ncbi:MAG: thermonuclease family protein [Paracoccaceae bacterium]|nr:thermonuclease family protein [Paracoccaceae bacterium]